MLEISSQLFPVRISFCPSPVFPGLLHEKLVRGSVAVDSSSWIAIPIPDTSEFSTCFEELCRQTQFAKSVQTIQTAESSPYNQSVHMLYFGRAVRFCPYPVAISVGGHREYFLGKKQNIYFKKMSWKNHRIQNFYLIYRFKNLAISKVAREGLLLIFSYLQITRSGILSLY
jgi:hypothetical protein